MSYYSLPKNKNSILLNPISSLNNSSNYISYSLINYYNYLNSKLLELIKTNKYIKELELKENQENQENQENEELHNYYDFFIKSINHYEYLYSKIPNTNDYITNLKYQNVVIYDLIEINSTLNLFNTNNKLNLLIISPNYLDIIYFFELTRENYKNDNYYVLENFNITKHKLLDEKFEFIYYEPENDTNFFKKVKPKILNKNLVLEETISSYNDYIVSLSQVLLIILRNQNVKGNCIIKINELFLKPVLDILYFLCYCYENVYIIKPNSNNIISYDKYIVCNNFLLNTNNNSQSRLLKLNFYRLLVFLKKLDSKIINGLLDFEIPCYFKNKINDLNNIIGEKQLSYLDELINILNSKNINEKLEYLKKSNIKKVINWCEKYNIPYSRLL